MTAGDYGERSRRSLSWFYGLDEMRNPPILGHMGKRTPPWRRGRLRLAVGLMGLSIVAFGWAQSPRVITQDLHLNPVTGAAFHDRDVVVRGCTVTLSGSHAWRSLRLEQGARLTHAPADPEGLSLTVRGDLLLDASSLITASGKGYPGSQGPGAGQDALFIDGRGGGGGYGGGGGSGLGAKGGSTYGQPLAPLELGSGGGGGGPWPGSPGGGAIRLTIGGVFRLEGALSADGADGSFAGGSGSGGSIWLECALLTGQGTVSARGGSSAFAGGGGGGRVRTDVALDQFEGWVDTTGGLGYIGSNGQKGTRVAAWLAGRAAILRRTDGEISPLGPPASLLPQVQPLALSRAFPEVRDVVVDGATVDVAWPAVDTVYGLPFMAAQPLVGVTRLSSTLVHFDPVDPTGMVSGILTFDDPVVALISRSETLDQTDPRFARQPLEYPFGNPTRGLEPGDTIQLLGPRTLQFHLSAGTDVDQFRVLTASPNLFGVLQLDGWIPSTAGHLAQFTLAGLPHGTAELDRHGRFWGFVRAVAGQRLAVRVPGWLGRLAGDEALPQGVRGCGLLHGQNGDVDGDNQVTVFDYDRLSAAFDARPGDAQWDPAADLDGDGQVTVFDYDLLSASFDAVGDE